jgi:hypothetical protein
MRNEGLAKTLIAGAAVAARRIVKFGSSDTAVIQASAAADLSIGVSDLGGASGEYTDVIVDGIALVEYGGNVTRGQLLTADSDGKAVAAAPAATASARVIGVAMLSGVSGDIGSVLIDRSTVTNGANS